MITQVAIDGVEISVVDREHMSAQKTTKYVTTMLSYLLLTRPLLM